MEAALLPYTSHLIPLFSSSQVPEQTPKTAVPTLQSQDFFFFILKALVSGPRITLSRCALFSCKSDAKAARTSWRNVEGRQPFVGLTGLEAAALKYGPVPPFDLDQISISLMHGTD